MNRTRIYLIRHGQVEGFEEKRYNGQGEVALTAQGLAQFGILQMRLRNKPIAAVYSSDLGRCREGALLVAQPHALEPILREDLRELHIGDWEGMTWQELKEKYPIEWQARLDDIVHYRVSGGESLLEMADRVRQAMAEILAAHRGEEVVVIGHGGVNRSILLDAIGAPLERLFHIEQDFGCLNIIDHYPDGISVVKLLNG
jgi:alpha-ribazole phosphatase